MPDVYVGGPPKDCQRLALLCFPDVISTYRVNTAEGERGGKHADVLPVELLLLLAFDQDLGEAVRDVFTRVHALLDSHDHCTIDFDKVVVELCGTSVGPVRKPLQRFNKIDKVRQGACDRHK